MYSKGELWNVASSRLTARESIAMPTRNTRETSKIQMPPYSVHTAVPVQFLMWFPSGSMWLSVKHLLPAFGAGNSHLLEQWRQERPIFSGFAFPLMINASLRKWKWCVPEWNTSSIQLTHLSSYIVIHSNAAYTYNIHMKYFMHILSMVPIS